MNPILQAFQEGYSEDEIMGFINKAIPQFVPAIKKATRSGYGVKEILGFLSKNFDIESTKGKSENQIHAMNQRADTERAKYGLGIAATAIAAPIAGVAARAVLSRALPQSLTALSPYLNSQNPLSTPPTNPGANYPSGSASVPTSPQPQVGNQPQNVSSQPPINVNQPNITGNAPPVQPKAISNPKDYLDKLGITEKVKEMLSRGNTPEGVAAALGMKRSGEAKIDPELLQNITEFSKLPKDQAVSTTNLPPESTELVETQKNEPVEEENIALPGETTYQVQKRLKIGYADASRLVDERDQTKPNEPIKNSSIVASPHGVGEVKAIRKGQAIVEIDGKKHKVSEDELIQSPLPEKELADLYQDVISGIERDTGQQVSRNVEWAGYDPNSNELAYKPHGSDKLYAYDDISEEDIKELTSLLTQRKTTGQNFIGAWEKGTTSPIGAAMYKLIQKLQAERGGKGNEYKNRYETVYDAMEPAKSALKRKHAEAKKKAKKSRTD